MSKKIINKDKKQRMNWAIVASNLSEAREQLEEIERRIKEKKYPGEGELYVSFQHVYHHLNLGWNARKIKTKEYTKMTDSAFNKYSRYPKEIDTMQVTIKKRKKK
jgi:hypothetical protein